MMSIFFLFVVLLFVSFFLNFSSFLNSLLLLESLSLLLFFFIFYLMIYGCSMKFMLYFFVFIVSESAIGLSILVLSMKMFGSSNFSVLGINKL